MESVTLAVISEATLIASHLFIIGGGVLAILTLKVASNTLTETKKATRAQVFFSIQRFGFQVRQSLFASSNFNNYLSGGISCIEDNAQDEALRSFGTLLFAYNIVSFQHKLGYVDDAEWKLFKREFCNIMQSAGANDYFERNPIENSLYDDAFKEMIINCRKEEPRHAATL